MMDTNRYDPEALDRPDHVRGEAVIEYLRAHGVKPATRRWEPSPGVPVKQRPMWLGFIVRTLRKLRLY